MKKDKSIQNDQAPKDPGHSSSTGLSVGLSLGVLIGVVMDNIGLGLMLGVAAGLCAGSAIGVLRKSKKSEDYEDNNEK